ncbi:MAG: hypothetical protein H0Z40_01325 [Desulfotomaculum sp.]|nr:hypothetical protein [Desulfotomaculum sp.]
MTEDQLRLDSELDRLESQIISLETAIQHFYRLATINNSFKKKAWEMERELAALQIKRHELLKEYEMLSAPVAAS